MTPRTIVVMGVSGSGKSLIGRLLADHLGWIFVDADDHHSAANVEKMRSGHPLTDEDRQSWLATLHELIATTDDLVLACSALKEDYRATLRGDLTDISFVHLHGDFEQIRARLEKRQGHYMPSALLRSQFDALETPGDALVVDCMLEPEQLVRQIVSASGLG